MSEEKIIEFRGIKKQFPGVLALNDISFHIKKGEIHALCGENGAGKSTLINLCGGVIPPTEGDIIFKGGRMSNISPGQAYAMGIGVIFQEVPMCGNLSIAGNIFLGENVRTKNGILDWNAMNAEAGKLISRFGLKYHPTTRVERLSIAEQSLVQIAKVIHRQPDLLILDEPTSALSGNQKDLLFSVLREMRDEREMTILYVSHRMEEIFEISDAITILRDGAYRGTWPIGAMTIDKAITEMVGRHVDVSVYKPREHKETVLEMKGVSQRGRLSDISFSLKSGEILGLAGLQGAGRTELAHVVFGLEKRTAGEIYVRGEKTNFKSPKDAINARVGYISENRRDEGIFPLMSVEKNMIKIELDRLCKWCLLDNRRIKDVFSRFVSALNIKISGPKQQISKLSGGNQQKVIISSWLASKPGILICDEPTRGVDVGAKAEVHVLLTELAASGIGIILISSELPELMSVCDRVIVMHEGTVSGEISREDFTEERIMRLAAGLKE
ncbi:MAG: sugar ABC transporter ATP-binding protein [Synergistaceae bacterium]|nr:sugar ABC transporter ATP-binding protein [Synergistaceae bacterium]